MTPRLVFRDISRETFIDRYWQQRPIVLRQALSPALLRLPAEELAGLACEEGVESRLIVQAGPEDWRLRHGPFDEDDFRTLPERDWTLLVQDADKHLPEVWALLDAFDFVPDWRLDDIMISYAVEGGGVGPHTDNYDVFLVQAAGHRRWRLSDRTFNDSDLLPDCPLRVVREFPVTEEWLLEPGDTLYLPPGTGHWGIAEGECMTWSVGMRGPADTELAAAWIERLSLVQRPHLGDSISSTTPNPTAVQNSDFVRAIALLRDLAPEDGAQFRRWLGCYLTEPKAGFEIDAPDTFPDKKRIAALRAEGYRVRRHPWARFALVPAEDARLTLCCQGEALDVAPGLAAAADRICRERRFSLAELPQPEDSARLDTLLARLFARGWLIEDE